MRVLNFGKRYLAGWLVAVFLVFTLSACQPAAMAAAPELLGATATEPPPAQPVIVNAPSPTVTAAEAQAEPTETQSPTPTVTAAALKDAVTQDASARTHTPVPTPVLVEAHPLPPEAWKDWPVIPQVPENARRIYQQGLALGNDPRVFSILGDCQSLPETFLGVYDTHPALVAGLPADLRETVANFAGSFDRLSPTVKGGTTAGAILWNAWHENAYSCQANESPLACELRLYSPSIVIINLGTHYETRNLDYLRKILDQLIAQGIVPILSTKADNRELDDRLNQEMALLAVEYNVPLWNFYAAVSDLPNNGVGIKEGEEHLGEIYLSEEGLERHRYTALQALAAVWQVVRKP